jgi:hypothetical protein
VAPVSLVCAAPVDDLAEVEAAAPHDVLDRVLGPWVVGAPLDPSAWRVFAMTAVGVVTRSRQIRRTTSASSSTIPRVRGLATLRSLRPDTLRVDPLPQ